jgi:hypothetical protein
MAGKLVQEMVFGIWMKNSPFRGAVGVAIVAFSLFSGPMATAIVRPAAESTALAAILAPGSTGATAAVQRARADSGLVSTLLDGELDARLAKLLQWVVRDYANSGPLGLLSAAPEGRNAEGRSNTRLLTLQKTYWLQDNSLYGAAALDEYVPVLGKLLSESWRNMWQKSFANFCPDTQSDYAIGRIPPYDHGVVQDPRCRLPRPGVWQFFREYQYPSPADPQFDSLPKPIFGTDYPAGPEGATRLAPITRRSPRNLLKYGCLRQVLLGNGAVARQMFDLALADWDGSGFITPKNNPQLDGRLSGVYWTRDLAFALLCGNALGLGRESEWGGQQRVAKSSIERELWNAQSSTGGFWTNYCGATAAGSRPCSAGQKIPAFAKQTNEIAPLVLLAYGPNIWASRR